MIGVASAMIGAASAMKGAASAMKGVDWPLAGVALGLKWVVAGGCASGEAMKAPLIRVYRPAARGGGGGAPSRVRAPVTRIDRTRCERSPR
jgi:hypothetical protein